jgi:hypothetical protein
VLEYLRRPSVTPNTPTRHGSTTCPTILRGVRRPMPCRQSARSIYPSSMPWSRRAGLGVIEGAKPLIRLAGEKRSEMLTYAP